MTKYVWVVAIEHVSGTRKNWAEDMIERLGTIPLGNPQLLKITEHAYWKGIERGREK